MNHFLEIHLVLEFNLASGFMRFKEVVGIKFFSKMFFPVTPNFEKKKFAKYQKKLKSMSIISNKVLA